jgi:hypothetical protein
MDPKRWELHAARVARAAPLRPPIHAALRCGFCMLALFILSIWGEASARQAHEAEIDTEHLFGFTIGSGIGKKGEKELESETNTLTGKNGGTYAAVFDQLEAKYTLAQSFRIAAAAVLAYHNINGIPDIGDLHRGAFQGGSVDARIRLLDLERSAFGFTMSVEPHWNRIDDVTGQRVQNYGGAVRLALDKEIVAWRLYAAVNLLYQPEVTHFFNAETWVRQSTIGISGAITMRVGSGLFMGSEVVYRRLYDGLGFDSFAGHALFAGPTFYAKLSEHWWASLAWNVQVSGHAADRPGALDLVNFERHRATLRFGYHF